MFGIPGVAWYGNLTPTAFLTSSDGAVLDHFGRSVSIGENAQTIVVGAPDRFVNAHSYQGEAYVYIKPGSGWSGNRQEAFALVSSDGTANDGFGGSTGINFNGNRIIVGAKNHQVSGYSQQGAAYIFEGPWPVCSNSPCILTESAILTSSDGAESDNLGYSSGISLTGEVIVVGAPNHMVNGHSAQGAAYLFLNQSVNYLPLLRK